MGDHREHPLGPPLGDHRTAAAGPSPLKWVIRPAAAAAAAEVGGYRKDPLPGFWPPLKWVITENTRSRGPLPGRR